MRKKLVGCQNLINREVVEEFARACEEEGVSQASQLTKMMKEFVEKRK